MRQSTRLILNTGATFARMGVTVLMGLVATRLVYLELGKAGFDLWVLLTATATFALFFVEACYGSAERSMAMAIGVGDVQQLRRVVGNAVLIQLVIAGLYLGLGIGLARVVLPQAGVTPTELARATTAFNLIIGAYALFAAAQVFRSVFVAHQSLVWLTLVDLLESTLRLGAIIATMLLPGERLITYCLMLLIAQAGVLLLLLALCWVCYRPLIPRPRDLQIASARALLVFAAWASLGNLSYRVRASGPQIILGRAFATAFNGAYGVASQLAGYQVSLAAAILRAANPALNAAHGRGDRATVERLAHLVNKYGVLLATFYIVPLAIETPLLLKFWLETPPPSADIFVRLAVVAVCIPWLTMGHHLAVFAHGVIRRYMTLSLAFEVAALALGGLAVMAWQRAPWTVLAYSVVGQIWIGLLTLNTAWSVQGFSMRAWVRRTVLPIALVVIPAGAIALAVRLLLPPDLLRILAVGAAYAVTAAPLIWLVGMQADERAHFSRIAAAALARVPGLRARLPVSGSPPA